MSYAKYESYKDSGVDWLGEIPSDWDLVPLRAIFRFRNEKNNPVITENILSLSIAKGVTGYDDENRGGNKRKDDITAYKIARPNDIVLNSMNVIVGAVGVSKYFGAISPVYYALYAFNDLGYVPYFNWIFQNTGFQKGLLKYGKGILIKLGEEGKMNTIRMKISQDDLKVLQFPLPNFEKQTKIANFLDQKTAQIDQAIALKQQQIEKLNEYKQIVIQNAVTKGLNPNAPMKNSGVDWIGDIPEHWDVKKLKYLTSKIGSGITPSGGATTYVDKGIPLLRSQNIHFDGLVLDNVANISLNVHKSMKNSQVKQHDVLLNITGGSLGRCCYNSSNDEMNVNQHVCIVRPNNLIKGEFLNGLMSSEVGQKQIWFFQQGGGREGLNFQNLKNFDFPLPSIDEQKEIIAHIESLKQHFKKSVDNYQTQIDRLKEYKNILINQAVTGKIKI